MIEAYENELEKIIIGLEKELDDLLKERKSMFFTFKLDRQVSRIKSLLKKYRAESKKLKDKPKTRKTIVFIRGLIRKILGLNLIANRLLTERKEAEQEELPQAKQENKEDKDSKESDVTSENEETSVKKSKEKTKQQNPTGKESLFTHIDKEDISSLPYIHPKTLDIHLISLLELEKTASDCAVQHPSKEFETPPPQHNLSHEKKEEPTHHIKTIIERKTPEHIAHLTEDIKNHHHDLLEILSKKTEIDLKEHQLRESNLYNTRQLYLLNNYLLHHQEKRNTQHKTHSFEFTPLLINSLIKLEIFMQVIEKYLLSLTKAKKQKTLTEKYQLEVKKHGGITRVEHLARIKTELDTNASHVKKHKLSKTSGHRHQGNL